MKKLTEELRKELKGPFGNVVDESELVEAVRGMVPLICIGDYCADVLLRGGRRPDVLVYDFKTMRGSVSGEVKDRIGTVCKPMRVRNPPGVITDELMQAVKTVLEKGEGDIFVDGEEDLAGLVAITYAPEGAVVVYGMPLKGAAVVKINREVKNRALRILDRMEQV